MLKRKKKCKTNGRKISFRGSRNLSPHMFQLTVFLWFDVAARTIALSKRVQRVPRKKVTSLMKKNWMKEGRYRDGKKNCYFFFKIIYSLKTLLSNSGPKSTKTQKKLFQDKTQMKKMLRGRDGLLLLLKNRLFWNILLLLALLTFLLFAEIRHC